jgi:hypothetical protein
MPDKATHGMRRVHGVSERTMRNLPRTDKTRRKLE